MPYKDPEQAKAARRQHYLDNVEAYREKNRQFRQKKRDMIKAAKDGPCTDCGIKYPYYVMQFDHLGDKEYALSDTSRVSIKTLMDEIAKCELVCANCHFERTHQRGQHLAQVTI